MGEMLLAQVQAEMEAHQVSLQTAQLPNCGKEEVGTDVAMQQYELAMLQQQEMAMQAQIAAQYGVGPQPAQTQTAAAENAGAPDNTLYALAQLAEESAHMAASAAAFCSNPGSTDVQQIAAVTEAAQQAAQRAHWAASTATSYEPNSNTSTAGQTKTWEDTMRQIAVQAAESAEKAAQECRNQVASATGQPPTTTRSAGSRVPCKFHQGMRKCVKGAACEFSHDPADLQPRPLSLKTERECIFFGRGQCTRGAACPFAHGTEELAEISRVRATRFRQPWDHTDMAGKDHFSRKGSRLSSQLGRRPPFRPFVGSGGQGQGQVQEGL